MYTQLSVIYTKKNPKIFISITPTNKKSEWWVFLATHYLLLLINDVKSNYKVIIIGFAMNCQIYSGTYIAVNMLVHPMWFETKTIARNYGGNHTFNFAPIFFGRCYTLAVSDDKMYRNDLIFTENRGIMIIVDLGNRVCWCKFYPNLLSSNSHQGQSHRTRLIFCWIRRWWISSLS